MKAYPLAERWLCVGVAMALWVSPFLPGSAVAEDKVIRITTLNMDEGTDFQELLEAKTVDQFVAAVTTTFQNIEATQPAERAAAMAREIARQRPDLVGLQEASVVRTGSAPPATMVHSDLLQSLMLNLEELGEHYAVIAVVPGLDAEAPSTLGFDVRLTTQDAIIARTDRTGRALQLSNVQVKQFATNLTLQTPIGLITIPRGWASVDVTYSGQSFRFVTTHLDTVPAIQLAQAQELATTAANSNLPVLLAGDFNAAASDPTDPGYPTYQAFIERGFEDAWNIAHSGNTGFTCCQAPDLLNPVSALTQRIDLVLFHGEFDVQGIKLSGDKPRERTSVGLWPSDHAGVHARLTLSNTNE